MEDGGDCCVRCEGGAWAISNVRLRCAHGAAVLAYNEARVTLDECVLGGEGEEEMGKHVMLSAYGSVQVQGLAKRACYALVLRDTATAVASHCIMQQCSEAALLVAHRSRAHLKGCHISQCAAAFISGQGRGRALELTHCTIEKSAKKLWADADRPRALVWGEGNTSRAKNGGEEDGADDEDDEDDDTLAEIQPPQHPRGAADGESSDSDDSLTEQEFANMEALMAELDDAELAR